MFEKLFTGKRILVTGAGRGFGRALVKRLHGYGAKITALSKTLESLQSLEKECPGITTICVDLADWDATRETLKQLEAFDCVVNNAAHFVISTLMGASPDNFDKLMAVNVKAALNVCQITASKMIEAKKSGSIVNVSSLVATMPSPLYGIYGSSKAALHFMTKTLAVELAPKGIRVNIIQPAGIEGTNMLQQAEDMLDQLYNTENFMEKCVKARIPSGCCRIPMDDCINTLLFLLSDLAPQTIGQSIIVDGGMSCT